MQRGVDRGELPKGTPMGQLRDVFFGTLEFSARTLKLRKRSYDHSVVTNLLSIMVCSTGGAAGRPKDEDPSNRDLMNTLKSIQKQLQTSGNSQSIGRRFQSYRSHHSIDSTISAKGPGNPCPALPLPVPPTRAPPKTLPLIAGKEPGSTALNQQGSH